MSKVIIPSLYVLDLTSFRKQIRPLFGPLIGIDPGSRSTGVAISDPARWYAKGLGTINSTRPEELATKINWLAKDVRAVGFVCGYPVNLNDPNRPESTHWKEGILNLVTELYRQEFYSDTNIENCLLWHEEFSTKSAMYSMPVRKLGRYLAKGKRDRKFKEQLDAAAAEVILQDAIDGMNIAAAPGSASGISKALAQQAIPVFDRQVERLQTRLKNWR
eukprot:CAMPEP_0184745010 /NCGR_PEP_ID=MMETSP0315-20130426/7757_1 /TAXON_ID=101924 /ORGANISM="Rhodosorus marinus, Strain UTEX LB 2760" /LENGTH=217 /DNA_ID=CAMNT_0027217019 /DNA_START=142 /DNA_END=795 /DNA_ORIENTATION=+